MFMAGIEQKEIEKTKRREAFNKIQVIESEGKKKVFVKGQEYMMWEINDQISQRIAIVQLYKIGLANQEELSDIFDMHVNTIYNYINNFETGGIRKLVGERSGPKQNWKIVPEVRGKILVAALMNNIKEYTAIQKELKKKWNIDISIESIRQVLMEDGLIRLQKEQEDIEQLNFFDNEDKQLLIGFNCEHETTNDRIAEEKNSNRPIIVFDRQQQYKGLKYYSSAERIYLDQLKQGIYNMYGGGLLLVPMLQQYNFLFTIKQIINIKTYEGYCLEQLCLTLFYFDVFGFNSIENFKTVYPEEFGILIGKLNSPSLFTLRRFLHKVRELQKGEELICEFGKEYLKSGLVNCKVLYIDEHFLPYYGARVISMGWFTLRDRPLKGSYNFIANDEEFNPLIFFIRPSSEDLVDKIPEIINKVRGLAEEVGIEAKDLTVIFDREGYSAKLFRRLDGEEGEPKVKFISWAKYADKWVNDFNITEFKNSVMVKYNVQENEAVKYFVTDRTMSKYGKIRTIVIQSGRKNQRSAIYTNDWDSDAGLIIQLICRRWGQENLIKTLKLKHLIDYHPGYVSEELEEQPLVENPELVELKQCRANLMNQLHGLELKLAEKILNEVKDETNLKEIKQTEIEIFSDIATIKSQITLVNQELDKLPKEVKFNTAHDGTKLAELDYEKKRFLDCIKIFAYHMEKKMNEILMPYYNKKKELYPALAMIIRRGAYVKLERGKLTVNLRRFKNPEIDYAARCLCEELNKMSPVTLDKFHLPINYGVI